VHAVELTFQSLGFGVHLIVFVPHDFALIEHITAEWLEPAFVPLLDVLEFAEYLEFILAPYFVVFVRLEFVNMRQYFVETNFQVERIGFEFEEGLDVVWAECADALVVAQKQAKVCLDARGLLRVFKQNVDQERYELLTT